MEKVKMSFSINSRKFRLFDLHSENAAGRESLSTDASIDAQFLFPFNQTGKTN